MNVSIVYVCGVKVFAAIWSLEMSHFELYKYVKCHFKILVDDNSSEQDLRLGNVENIGVTLLKFQ